MKNKEKNDRAELIRSDKKHKKKNMVILTPNDRLQKMDKVQEAFLTSMDEITVREEREKQ